MSLFGQLGQGLLNVGKGILGQQIADVTKRLGISQSPLLPPAGGAYQPQGFPVLKPSVHPVPLTQDPRQQGVINIMTNRPALPGGAPVPALPMIGPGNQTQSGFGGQSSTGAGCERGYHRNKTGYYTQRYGWVPAGSVCVKNRRRNPLNPRALSRSISRITSAKNASRFLSRVTVRERGCGCK